MLARAGSFASAVLVVLACAAVAFAVRGALAADPVPPVSTPRAGAGAVVGGLRGEVALSAAESRMVPAGAALIATATRRSVRVHRDPSSSRRGRLLRQRIFNGQRIPLVFLVRRLRDGWVQVRLPTRPNKGFAWVRRKDIRLSFTRMRVRVSLARHRLEVFEGRRRLVDTRIGVGRSVSPTPKGRYYITDVVRPPDPGGSFGPYALGLSAHSKVYSSFLGGNGQIGIHGTNRPAAIGTDVSHGCVRIANSVITRLARTLPAGTPVTIAA